MTSVASTNKSSKKHLAATSIKHYGKLLRINSVIIIFILISAIFLSIRLYRLPDTFKFAYDAQIEAEGAWDIFYNKNLTLIGQETSVGGLFVGPLLFYLQTCAMLVGRFNPMSLAYLAVVVSFLTLINLFIVISELFNKKQAIIGTFLYAISLRLAHYDTFSNAQSYVMIISLLTYWVSYKIFIKKQDNKLPFLALCIGGSLNIHFALFLLIPTIALCFIIYRPKIRYIYYLFAALITTVSLLPFIIFDIKNNFLITNNILKFSNGQSGLMFNKISETINTFLAVSSEIMYFHSQYYIFIFLLFFSGFIIIMIRNNNFKLLKLTLLFILIPILLLCIYKGNIPEYYFLPLFPLLIIILSTVYYSLLTKSRLWLILLIPVIIYNLKEIKTIKPSLESFSFKDRIVNWIISDANNSNFNVYYDLPLEINNGYTYLFKWKNKEPIDFANNLYIITLESKIDEGVYKKNFQSKTKVIKNFGTISVISVQ